MTPPNDQATANALRHLEWSIRALAQEPAVQSTLYPAFACVADELALEFEEWFGATRERHGEFAEDEKRAIERLDGHLASMSGSEREDLWDDEALQSAPEWAEVRRLANEVLNTMGWTSAPPPAERATYIGPDA